MDQDQENVLNVVAVASHPRSGTHLLIDFLRLNFPFLNTRLPFWRSSSFLYFDLDRPKGNANFFRDKVEGDACIIIKTHELSPLLVRQRIFEEFNTELFLTLMPFRKYERTLASFMAFLERCERDAVHAQAGFPIDIFTSSSLFFENLSALESAKLHADNWLNAGALAIDIDGILGRPELSAEKIAFAFDSYLGARGSRLKPAALPRRKKYSGKLAELHQRFSGRESTEVQIDGSYVLSGSEELAINNELAPIYERLRRISINSAVE